MLELLNRYAHGYVAVPVVLSLRNGGFFHSLRMAMSFDQLAGSLSANPGHLRVAVRLLESLGWCRFDQQDGVERTSASDQQTLVLGDLSGLYEAPLDDGWVGRLGTDRLAQLLSESSRRWNITDDRLADLVDGAFVVPLLLSLRLAGVLPVDRQPMRFSDSDPANAENLERYFLDKGWGVPCAEGIQLTEAGEFLSSRILNMGTVASYRPMLARMDELLFGSAAVVFARDDERHEGHVDRWLNVQSSGLQHEKYFADLQDVVVALFDRPPLAEQPRYIADMGCGDGTLLKRLYEAVRERSARGKALDEHPLTLIGVDYNQKSLEATAQTLAGLPHRVVWGDVGDPEQMVRTLVEQGVHDPENILHVRSFLDHDRPYLPPREEKAARARGVIPYTGVYAERSGKQVQAAEVVQSLVEHLGTWSRIVTRFGLLSLEVHSLPPSTVRNFLDESENLHYDAFHGFSGQLLVEPQVYLLAAAEAGLFARAGSFRRYPRVLPFTRITLSHFERRSYLVRHARLEDIPALDRLEEACWPAQLRAPVERLARRVEVYPEGQFVLELEGRVAGALYTQRIGDVGQLDGLTDVEVERLHRPDGPVVQLLAANIYPEVQHQGLGDQLLEFVLQILRVHSEIARIVGVTRCRNYPGHRSFSLEQYVRLCDADGAPIDPILRFHHSHGANVVALMRDFRPADQDNDGTGVLIEYDAQGASVAFVSSGGSGRPARLSVADAASMMEQSVRRLLGDKRQSAYAPARALMEMGLDSLELLELRVLLGHIFDEHVEATFFFSYATPQAIVNYFARTKPHLFASRLRLQPQSKELSDSHAEPALSPMAETSILLGQSAIALSRASAETADAWSESIAVVGMACRFPGGCDSPEQFWGLLQSGREVIVEVPASRWSVDAHYDPHGQTAGKTSSRHGGFLNDADRFDAGFFNITPREAASIDPQHRLLLETAWEALENAGLAPDALRESFTGVFIGISSHDYELLQVRDGSVADLDAYFSTGGSAAMAAGRLSYTFGFHGPAVSVNTACSSSLTAVHQACQALRQSECALALAGGVNMMLSPEQFICYSQAGMLSPDGHCKTFDAAANGYVRGEGCGLIVLKRLSDAERDGDPILAVIRGSAVNQDGPSNGLTAPNGRAQEMLLRSALRQAGLPASAVDYLEAHGTGTALGDPIEVQAAARVLGRGRAADRPLLLGSVKTNIGHLEAAAGIAGLIKVVLALHKGVIPRQLHFGTPNPHIPWADLAVRVVQQASEWPSGRRVGSVSSFGFSGTNVHVVLEAAPEVPEPPSETPEPGPHLLVLSARSGDALAELAGRYRQWLGRHPEADLAEVGFTAGAGRSHLEHRAALVASSPARAAALLKTLEAGGTAAGLYRGQGRPGARIAWLFSGAAGLYRGMAQELADTQPVFRSSLQASATVLAGELEYPLLELLGRGDLAGHPEWSEPALVAVQLGLAELWRGWGIAPDVLLGQGVGQMAAACAAGVLSAEAALRLAARRGRLISRLAGGTGLTAVFAPPAEVRGLLAGHGGLWLAADHGGHGVLRGPLAALQALEAELTAAGVSWRRLGGTAGCPPESERRAFASFAASFAHEPAQRTLVCPLSGLALDPTEVVEAGYWGRHWSEPLALAGAVGTLAELGCEVLLEVGPRPVLVGLAAGCWPEDADAPTSLASLRPGQSDAAVLGEALARLYVAGATPDFAGLARPWRRRKVDLPTYPFQRQRYWVDAPRKPHASASAATPTLQLLLDGQAGPLLEQLGLSETASASQAFAALHGRHASELAASTLARHLYRLHWHRGADLPAAGPRPPRQWLILADRGGLGQDLARLLRRAGQGCRLLPSLGLDSDPETLTAALAELQAGPTPVAGVLHLGSLDLAPLDADAPRAMPRLTLNSSLHLLQTLERLALAAPVFWVTRAAHPAGEAATVDPWQRPVWGLAGGVALETPQRFGKLIDLPAGRDDVAAERVLAEVLADDGEERVALRRHGRWLARLQRQPAGRVATPLTVRATASYLITGGLGALGLHTAAWLAERGAGEVVLVGRRPPTAAARGQMDRIHQQGGCRVLVRTLDVGDAGQLGELRAWLGRDCLPLRGIVHAAGVLDDGVLAAQTPRRLATVLRPKLAAWGLHEAFASSPLDFFVLYSSSAAVLGSSGQGGYGAANAFLDGLADHRRLLGLPALSINWGPWAGAGMAAGLEARMRQMGIEPLAEGLARRAFAHLTGLSLSGILVGQIDWDRYARPLVGQRSLRLLAELVDDSPKAAPLATLLAAAAPGQRGRILEEQVRAAVAAVLGLDGSALDGRAGLFDLGMDSLAAVQLRGRLQAAVGVTPSLPDTLALDHPSIERLSRYLQGRLEVTPAAPSPEVSPGPVAGEPIAVIGLACRVPGADDAEAFWQLLEAGTQAIGPMPAERWDVEAYYDADPETPGKMYVRQGGFLGAIDRFDPQFFGIAPREARSMDPQHRLLLETAWTALEAGGQAPEGLMGSQCGVFIGIGSNDYAGLMAAAGDEALDAYYAIGASASAAAGRISHSLGLQGPALSIDTACSSSLAAVHEACASLVSGGCVMALAGGVNLMLTPRTHIALSRARMLSAEGRCRTFDASADGYVRSEGCGVVVLKRLSVAQRDGDRILAVIRGWAMNQDGRAGGITVPNGPAQERVIAEALGRAGVAPAEVSYVEAHGTGTALGDPIEVQAAARVLGRGRAADRPLLLGSVKTNIGHLEAAAGIAGLIKVVLALHKGVIPRQLHFGTPNPHIPWADLAVRVVQQASEWPSGRRVGSVSSFGFSGTNVHVVLEAAPEVPEPAAGPAEPGPHLVVVSARSGDALAELAGRYRQWLGWHPEADLAEVGFTAGAGRGHLEHRAALVASSPARAAALLKTLEAGGTAAGLWHGQSHPGVRIAWLFSGAAGLDRGMARELSRTQPAFRASLEASAAVLAGELEYPLLELLGRGDLAGHPEWSEPALVAVQLGLAELWRGWGIAPDVLLGQGVGQVAAACVAGVLSAEAALRLAARRGRLTSRWASGGGLTAVFAPPAEVRGLLAAHGGLSLAADHGGHGVLRGPLADLETLEGELTARGVSWRRLGGTAGCPPESERRAFASFAASFAHEPAQRTLVCPLSGLALGPTEVLEACYWGRHWSEPLALAGAAGTLAELGCEVLLEVGPRPVLVGLAAACWPEDADAPTSLASLRPGQSDAAVLAQALARLYVAGATPDFAGLARPWRRRKVDLPTYPFQRQRYWVQGHAPRPSLATPEHPLLGTSHELASGERLFTAALGTTRQPWLGDHRIYDTLVVPGATYAAMALHAAGLPAEVSELLFLEPLLLAAGEVRPTQVRLGVADEGGRRRFEVHSGLADLSRWTLHAQGVLAEATPAEGRRWEADVTRLRGEGVRVGGEDLRASLAALGLDLGPCFGSIRQGWHDGDEALVELHTPTELAGQLAGEPIAGPLLDQATAVVLLLVGEVDGLYLPWQYGRLVLRRAAPTRFYCHGRVRASNAAARTHTFDLHLLDGDGEEFGRLEGFAVKRAPREALLRGLRADSDRLLYALGWQGEALPASSGAWVGSWLVLGRTTAVGDLADALRSQGQAVLSGAPEQAEGLLGPAGASSLAGVVWLADEPAVADDVGGELVWEGCRRQAGGLVDLVRWLLRVPVRLSAGLTVVTRRGVAVEAGEDVDPLQGSLWGLVRVLQTEEPSLGPRLLDVESFAGAGLAGVVRAVTENQVALRGQRLLRPRLQPWQRSGLLTPPDIGDYCLGVRQRGTLEELQLQLVEVPTPGHGEVQVAVHTAGLNFRDVLNILGAYPGDPGPLGLELAGVVTAVGPGVAGWRVGQRVFGLGAGCLANQVNVPAALLQPLPAAMTFAEGATLPVVFATALRALALAGLRAGERILIHAAASGVGLAALQLAQAWGAEVYATASQAKQDYLRHLGVSHVYDSRRTDFADQVLADTGGAGVAVVLNSLTSEGFLAATVRTLGPNGRWVEIGKRDVWTPEQMRQVRPDVAYHLLALDDLIRQEPLTAAALVAELRINLEKETVEPLPRRVYPLAAAAAALRQMQQGRHVGKIVLSVAQPRVRGDGSYLITGGLGALGLEAARWLAEQGAGCLVLVGRRPPDAVARRRIDGLIKAHGCRVHVERADVGDAAAVRRLLEQVRGELPPLRGIVHAAGVLDDGLLGGQGWPRMAAVLGGKLLGAWHLHQASAGDPLDFFVLYGSAAATLGSAGQGIYACANAFLDGLAQHRRSRGRCALSVNWGPWDGPGMAAAAAVQERLRRQGVRPLRAAEAERVLEGLLRGGASSAVVLDVDWRRWRRQSGALAPLLGELAAAERGGEGVLAEQLRGVPAGQRVALLLGRVQHEVGQILGLSRPPGAETGFSELGMDSLMAVELRNRLQRQLGDAATLSATLAFDYPTIRAMTEHFAALLEIKSPVKQDALDSLTTDELAVMLANEDELAVMLANEIALS